MKTLIKNFFVIILTAVWLVPAVSLAAEISLNGEKNNFVPNEDFLVQVFLDTQNTPVNAVEGTVVFSPDLLALKEIRDGNSSVNFWVERPHSAGAGKVAFSGITTGGFSGPKMFLFSLVLEAQKIGIDSIGFHDIQVLANDGQGTQIPTTEIPFAFSVSAGSNGSPENLGIKDTDPPENFVPLIGSDPSIFAGKYFLAFSTVDKGVGIDHYAVRESFWGLGGAYIPAESPYLLKDQTLKSKIYVKATDRNGNERIVELPAQNKLAYFLQYLILGIILVICFFVFKKIWVKFMRQ